MADEDIRKRYCSGEEMMEVWQTYGRHDGLYKSVAIGPQLICTATTAYSPKIDSNRVQHDRHPTETRSKPWSAQMACYCVRLYQYSRHGHPSVHTAVSCCGRFFQGLSLEVIKQFSLMTVHIKAFTSRSRCA